MSFLTLVTSGSGVDSEHPFMEVLAASNDTDRTQIVTISIISIDYYQEICWSVIDIV